MAESKIKFDENEFWDDCLKIKDSTDDINFKTNCQKTNKKSKRQNSKTKPKNKKYKTLKSNKTNNSILTKSSIINEALLLENIELQKTRNKKENINKNKISLYDKAKKQMEEKEKNIEQEKETKILLEIEQCSFKPKHYKNKSIEDKILKCYGDTTIYQRAMIQQQRRMAKLAKLSEENSMKKNEPYPFQPEVTYKDLNHVFFSYNYCKEQADNDSNKIFLFRLLKAREEDNYRKEMLENPVNKKLRINWDFSKKLKRSVSQKDSLRLQKGLHNTLLTIKCTQNEETKADE